MPNLINIVLTSAVVASVISSIFLIWNSWRERVARRKEIIFKESLKMARERQDFVKEVTFQSQQNAVFQDAIFHAETYNKWLTELFDKNKLPKSAHQSTKIEGKKKDNA
jgi:hypothetical protein